MNFRNQKWQLSFTNMHLDSLFKTFINNLTKQKTIFQILSFEYKNKKKTHLFFKKSQQSRKTIKKC